MVMDIIEKVSPETTVKLAQLKEQIGGGVKGEKDVEARISLILSYVKAHEGEEITAADFAGVADYSSPTSAAHVIRKLIKKHRLIRERLDGRGKGHHYTYYVGNTNSTKPRENGPAVSNLFKEVQPQQEKQAAITAANEFADRVDKEIWGYIRETELENIGQTTKALRGFSNYIRRVDK